MSHCLLAFMIILSMVDSYGELPLTYVAGDAGLQDYDSQPIVQRVLVQIEVSLFDDVTLPTKCWLSGPARVRPTQ